MEGQLRLLPVYHCHSEPPVYSNSACLRMNQGLQNVWFGTHQR